MAYNLWFPNGNVSMDASEPASNTVVILPTPYRESGRAHKR